MQGKTGGNARWPMDWNPVEAKIISGLRGQSRYGINFEKLDIWKKFVNNLLFVALKPIAF